MTPARRAVSVLLLGLMLALAAVTGPVGAQEEPGASTTAATADDDAPTTLPEELGNIVGSADPGPEPEDAGDRGGWAQLALLGMLVGVVGLVLRHLFRSANRNEPPAPA